MSRSSRSSSSARWRRCRARFRHMYIRSKKRVTGPMPRAECASASLAGACMSRSSICAVEFTCSLLTMSSGRAPKGIRPAAAAVSTAAGQRHDGSISSEEIRIEHADLGDLVHRKLGALRREIRMDPGHAFASIFRYDVEAGFGAFLVLLKPESIGESAFYEIAGH